MSSALPSHPQELAAIKLGQQMHFSGGYANGLRQPSITYEVRIERGAAAIRVDLACSWLTKLIRQPLIEQASVSQPADAVDLLTRVIRSILESSQQPVFGDAKIVHKPTPHGGEFTVHQPCYDREAGIAVIQFATHLINASGSAQAGIAELEVHTAYDNLCDQLRKAKTLGFNNFHFLKEADQAGIPWQMITKQIYQLGQGVHKRWLNSSFTDKTPHLAVVSARNKETAASIMQAAGIPVPQHRRVASAEQASAVAKVLGYPVVVKPADLDGGVGVHACLGNEQALQAAYMAATRHSKNILVEKHVTGNDYRLQVVEGNVQGIILRMPGHVIGNGCDTVSELLDQQNRERASATDDRKYLHPIVRDQEAEQLLHDQGLTWASVVAQGEVVRLRGAANVASGGTPQQIPLHVAHPDNLDLAVRAAESLCLDVAGVDLLIPDIATSWLISGAAVCEVNAQPQMFTTMHAPMLQHLFGSTLGRIPIVVVLTDQADSRVSHAIHDQLVERQIMAGLARGKDVWLGRRKIATMKEEHIYSSAQVLLRNHNTQAMVVEFNRLEAIVHGWPFDRCDILVVDDGTAEDIDSNTDIGKLFGNALGLSPRFALKMEPDSHNGDRDKQTAERERLWGEVEQIIETLFPSNP
jgi:D-alanine-D-alanine ligase-like ATP-grasp enzyme